MELDRERASMLLRMFDAFAHGLEHYEYLFEPAAVQSTAEIDPTTPLKDRREFLSCLLILEALAHRLILEGGFPISELKVAADDAAKRCDGRLPPLPESISPAARAGSREDEIMHYLMNTGGCSRHNACLSVSAAGHIAYLLRENELLRERLLDPREPPPAPPVEEGTAECPFQAGTPVRTIKAPDGVWRFDVHKIVDVGDEKPCPCKGLYAPAP